jgi:hypothetical protein
LFQSVNGTFPASHLARIDGDGTFDATFAATAKPRVAAIALAPDGKVFHASQQNLVRHLATGAEDPGFAPVSAGGSSDDRFATLALAPDGKPIVGGNFTFDGGATRAYVARFNGDGTRDTSFAIAPDGAVEALAIQPDGRVFLGGLFTTVNGAAHLGIARINAAAAPTLSAARAESGALVLSWPQAGGNFVLEATALNTGTWSPLGVTPVVANGQNFVTNTAAGAGQFFRLRAQP